MLPLLLLCALERFAIHFIVSAGQSPGQEVMAVLQAVRVRIPAIQPVNQSWKRGVDM
jgi:hypothetical protein